MVYGFGRGSGHRGGAGFGFRGSSPPSPYVGRGRGGKPRCGYLIHNKEPEGSRSPEMDREQEIAFLRSQAEAIRKELNQVETRIKDQEAENRRSASGRNIITK